MRDRILFFYKGNSSAYMTTIRGITKRREEYWNWCEKSSSSHLIWLIQERGVGAPSRLNFLYRKELYNRSFNANVKFTISGSCKGDVLILLESLSTHRTVWRHTFFPLSLILRPAQQAKTKRTLSGRPQQKWKGEAVLQHNTVSHLLQTNLKQTPDLRRRDWVLSFFF